MSAIFEYAVRADGGRNIGLDIDGIRLLFQPDTADRTEEARGLAGRIANFADSQRALEFQLEAARTEATTLKERLLKLEARLSEARAINEAAISGRRRFFGPVLMRPVSDDWSGEVWLLDPEKKDRGFGLRFASVAEVRALHPELWVVGATADGVMLDAWGSP